MNIGARGTTIRRAAHWGTAVNAYRRIPVAPLIALVEIVAMLLLGIATQ